MPTQDYNVLYTIVIRDIDQYNFAIAYAGGVGNSYLTNPTNAAAILGINFPFSGVVDNVSYIDVSNGVTYFPELPVDQDSIIAPGIPSDIGLPTVDRNLIWCGNVVFAPPSETSDPTGTPIAQRRWIGGLEMCPTAEGGSNITDIGSRDSSRTLEGLGFPIRGGNNTALWNRSVKEYQASDKRSSWERLYVRLRTIGTTDCGIWRCHGSASALAGGALKITTSGALQVVNITAVGAETILGTSAVLDNEWHLLDILLTYADGAGGHGQIIVYLDHTEIFNFTLGTGQGLDQVQFHLTSDIGKWTAAADTVAEIDLDDWICADVPAVLNASLDFLTGSHVTRIPSPPLGSGQFTDWAGNKNVVNQGRNPEQRLSSDLVAALASALIDVSLAEQSGGASYNGSFFRSAVIGALNLGPVAAIVAHEGVNSTGADGTLGYETSAGIVDTSINQLNTPSFNSVMYRPSGLLAPELLLPFIIRHKKSVAAGTDTTRMLQSIVEHLGIWGNEDLPFGTGILNLPRIGYQHNAYYANTLWAMLLGQPVSQVMCTQGTYTGMGDTGVSLSFQGPPHFIFIRALTGGSRPVIWFGAGLGGHFGTTDRIVPNYILDCSGIGGSNLFTMQINSQDANINAVGVTYQYVIFSDPGMRFNLCGAYNRPNALVAGSNPLIDSTYLAAGGFIQNEILANTSTTEGLSYKGPGHGANDGTQLSGTAIANWGSFAAGVLNTRSGVHYATRAQVNYSLWRTTDACGAIMVQIFSYTGNGAGGTRTIPCTPNDIISRSAHFTLVQPHNAAGVFRDPSHTGVNSALVTNLTNTTLGIVAATANNTLSVGTLLNANGIVYDVFILLPGFDSNCINDEPWEIPIWNPPDIGVVGNGGLMLDGANPSTLLKDISGIYTLTPGLRHDELYDRQTGQPTVSVKIPDPKAKTGYIGG